MLPLISSWTNFYSAQADFLMQRCTILLAEIYWTLQYFTSHSPFYNKLCHILSRHKHTSPKHGNLDIQQKFADLKLKDDISKMFQIEVKGSCTHNLI